MRARRLDSWLIMSVDLFALFFAQIVAAHQLAGPLDGSERRAHLMRDEMDGLLVALPVAFGRAQLAADNEVLVAGRGGQVSQAEASGAKYGNTMP